LTTEGGFDDIENTFITTALDTIEYEFSVEFVKNEGKENECMLMQQTITYNFYKSNVFLSDEQDPLLQGLIKSGFTNARPELDRYREQWSLASVEYHYNSPEHTNVFPFFNISYNSRDKFEEELAFSTEFQIVLTDSSGYYYQTEEIQDGMKTASSSASGPNSFIKIQHFWSNMDNSLIGKNTNINNGYNAVWDEKNLMEVLHTEDSVSINIIDRLYKPEDDSYHILIKKD
jgi:hypothetical protein